MPYDEQLASRIRKLLSRRKGIEDKRMFGGVCFLYGGHMLVGVWKEFLIARVGPNDYDGALLEPHVRKFDITGKPMRGWVMVGPEGINDDTQLTGWIEWALNFVKLLPKK